MFILKEEIIIQKVASIDLEQVTLDCLFVWLEGVTHAIPCNLLIEFSMHFCRCIPKGITRCIKSGSVLGVLAAIATVAAVGSSTPGMRGSGW